MAADVAKPEYIRAAVIVVRDGQLLGFHGEDPATRQLYFFPPGGKPEPGESLVDCARRETLEETGYSVEPLPESDVVVRYTLDWAGEARPPCTTHFFYARLVGEPAAGATVHDADYHRGVAWVPLAEVHRQVAYGAGIYEAVVGLIAAYGGG